MKVFNNFNRAVLMAFVASTALMTFGLGATDNEAIVNQVDCSQVKLGYPQAEREVKFVGTTLGGSVASFVGKKLAIRKEMPKLASYLKYTSRGLMIPTASCALAVVGYKLANRDLSYMSKNDALRRKAEALQLTMPYLLTVRVPMKKLFGDKK